MSLSVRFLTLIWAVSPVSTQSLNLQKCKEVQKFVILDESLYLTCQDVLYKINHNNLALPSQEHITDLSDPCKYKIISSELIQDSHSTLFHNFLVPTFCEDQTCGATPNSCLSQKSEVDSKLLLLKEKDLILCNSNFNGTCQIRSTAKLRTQKLSCKGNRRKS